MNVLFLSTQDFKEKSIQVIRKTPEAYVKNGANVFYVVARDTSRHGNYYYEKEINPEGVSLYRFQAPLAKLRDKINNPLILSLVTKIAKYCTIIKLAIEGNKMMQKYQIDVCYGYDFDGVLASQLLKLFGKLKNKKHVTRFMGTFYITDIIKNKKILKGILNWENFLALYLPSDMCIMTNDGTQGDMVLDKIKSKNRKNLKFWPNGVDEQKIEQSKLENLKKTYNPENKLIVVTVSRLVKVKRVDRGIEVVNKLVNTYGFKNFKYIIVGEGTEKGNLQKMVETYNVGEFVEFTGAVKNEEVKNFLGLADISLSTYDVSNVGNPLLESIRANKIIITLNNGDTKSWIKHEVNGYIFDINEDTIDNIAKCIIKLHDNEDEREKILKNIKTTESEKLWTWKERLNTEYKEVKNLLSKQG